MFLRCFSMFYSIFFWVLTTKIHRKDTIFFWLFQVFVQITSFVFYKILFFNFLCQQ